MYAILLFTFSSLSLFTLAVYHARTLYLVGIRLFTVLEFSVIALFLANVLKSQIVKKIIYGIVPVFIVYAVINYLFLSSNKYYPNLISALLLFTMIIYFFYEKMQTVVLYPLYQSITFWICVAFFLYFTGTFFFFLFINSSGDKEFIILMNSIYGIVTILKNILLCLAMLASEQLETDEDTELRIPTGIDLDEISLTQFKNP